MRPSLGPCMAGPLLARPGEPAGTQRLQHTSVAVAAAGTGSDAFAAPEPVFSSRTQTINLRRTVCSQVNARKNKR